MKHIPDRLMLKQYEVDKWFDRYMLALKERDEARRELDGAIRHQVRQDMEYECRIAKVREERDHLAAENAKLRGALERIANYDDSEASYDDECAEMQFIASEALAAKPEG